VTCAATAHLPRACLTAAACLPVAQITDAAANLLVHFITQQHRGVHANNLRRRDEIVSMLRGSRELLCKRAAERLLRLGQACVDDEANEALGCVEFGTLLRVCTEALNTLVFALVEGVEAFAELGSTEPNKRILDRYLSLDYATKLIAAGHPDECAEIPASVPYGDKRDDASGEDEPAGEGAGLLGPRMSWAVFAFSTVLALALVYWKECHREDAG
jgi:hypothetical protein